MLEAAPPKTLADLEWPRVVEAVVMRCAGPMRRAGDLPLAATHEGMAVALAETAEATDAFTSGEPVPLEGLRDLREHLARVERMGALDAPALRDVISVVGAARVLRRFLGTRRRRMPRLFEACSTDPTLDALEEELCAAIDTDGTVFDHASPALRALRTEVANLRARIVARLEELLVKHADVLSDRFYTVRDGRYVLPLRTDAHEKIPGLVHGASASGATVFIEPRALVESGNRLRLAEAEMEREVARILAVLTDLVRERVAPLRAACDALDHADLRVASARLGLDLRGTFPALVDDAHITLRGARHPLLALDGVPVVANDLALASGRALVISGPNAGGKTVALKTLGLAALMVRAGLPVPAEEGSACGFFARVLTDVGDDQSLTKNLSTFSAHVTNVAAILEVSDARTLVLLDELAGGTDPEEGAALACAVIDALCKRGAAIAVTTHYEPLKALALHDARLRNASVGFDAQSMQPTFRVLLDVPGASSALVVAARFGIPAGVIEVARRVLPDQARSFDELVRKLEQESHALAIERAGLEEERSRAAAARAEAEREREALRARDKAQVSREAEQLVTLIRRTRDEVRAARARLRGERPDEATVEAARRVVDEAAAKVALGGPLEEATAQPSSSAREGGTAPAPAELRPGMRVHVPRLRADAEIVEAPQKGRVRVAAGQLKLWVGIDEVRALAPAPTRDAGRAGLDERVGLQPGAEPPLPPPLDGNTIDLRGMRVDDALALLETFLDRSYGASERVGYVLHGHGTGALREAVRRWLAEPSSYVARSRPALPDEGGDRYTIVWLR
jgi:DNA mismatch repair protein MutS2